MRRTTRKPTHERALRRNPLAIQQSVGNAAMHITFQLEGGPWDGQTISTTSASEVTAEFARAMFLFSRGAPIGARIPLAAPSADAGAEPAAGAPTDSHRGDGDPAEGEAPTPRTHAYAVRQRRETDDAVTIKAVHTGAAS